MDTPFSLIVEVKKRGIVTIQDTTRKVLNIHEGTILVLTVEEIINEEKNNED